MTRKFEVEVREAGDNGLARWGPLYPDAGTGAERADLERRLGDWTREAESDLIGGPIRPAWVAQAEGRLAELDEALRPIPLQGRTPVRLRCTDDAVKGLEVTAEVRNRLHDTDPLGYEPTGAIEVAVVVNLNGEHLGRPAVWIDPETIHRARREWAGMVDIRESIYDMASHLIHAAARRLQPVRFDGFTYVR